MVCPHCQAPTAQPGSFCVSCGKAMPSDDPRGPRILGANDLASSQAGRSLQVDQLARHIRTGYRTLLCVGVFQLALGAIASAVALVAPPAVRGFEMTALVVASIGAAFLGLAMWAKRSPLPATVTGLVLFLSGWFLDFNADPSIAMKNAVIKLAIAIFLARAVIAAVKTRALARHAQHEQQQAAYGRAAPPAPPQQYRAAA